MPKWYDGLLLCSQYDKALFTNFHRTLFYLALTGTERCNEALTKLGKQYDVVVNIQGDEPLIEPEIIDGIVKALQVRELHSWICHLF